MRAIRTAGEPARYVTWTTFDGGLDDWRARQTVPAADAEFHVEGITDRKSRPVIAVSGTPEQVTAALQQVIDETGARRLLVETFSRAEARLFAAEVIQVLKQRNAV